MESIVIGAFSYCSAFFASLSVAETGDDIDLASITPLSDVSDSSRRIRFSDISPIKILNMTSSSSFSTAKTAAEEETEDEIIRHLDVSFSSISPISSYENNFLQMKTKKSPLSPPLLPSRGRNLQQQQQREQQQEQQHRYQQNRRDKRQDNRHQFLGHKNRIRRVRKLLNEDRRKAEE